MEEKRKTRVVMLRNHLNINSVNTEEPEKSTELKIRYADSPRLRDKVVDFVEEVCKATSRDIFHHICGRCGGCCSRENILVRGGDIFRISMHLGISEEEFVSEYIDDAGTWNKFDGYLKKNPENQCMFLEKVPSGKTRCKIHSVRPAQCREYQPMYVNCQKDIGKLINHLREIKIENDELTVFSCKNGESGLKHSDEFASKVTIKLEGELKGLFEEVIKITFEDGDEINKVQKMSRDAIELIQRFTEDLSNKMQEPDFEKQMEDLRTIVVRLEELIPFSRDGDQLLEELFVVFKRLEKLIQGKDEETAEEVDFSVKESLFESEKINLASINLFPGILSIDYSKAGENLSDSFLLSQNNNILASSRKLLKEITKLENMELQRKITDYDPPCYLCGICCSFYAVEIQPEDILRLAENLGMAYEDFRKKHIEPSRFSWNKYDGILKKAPLEGLEKNACVFLELKDDGFYYCSVHPFKPDVCRLYKANNPLCRTLNNRKYWYRLTDNIEFLEIHGDNLRIHTRNLTDEIVAIDWKDNKEIRESVVELTETISDLIK